jgi:purine-nucleoside phosphorylase
MPAQLTESLEFLKKAAPFDPEVGIILGSGLGSLGNEIETILRVPYSDIPGFPKSTVVGHAGVLIFGMFGGKKVMAMQGRFHFYEGYTMDQVVAPVRLMALLGAKYLLVSNACGGVNPDFEIGDLMVITDHINLFPTNPLMGPNNDAWGPRFPDMSQAYNKALISKSLQVAANAGIHVQQGVYAGLSGPCLETPAEYKYIRIIGADAVGMSTVPEVIAGHHMGMACFGTSVITDLGVEGKIVKTTHEDVVKAASEAASRLVPLFRGLIESL